MIYSLRLKILFSMVAVILVTVGMTAFLSQRAAAAEIERVQTLEDNRRNHRFSKLLARRYAEQGNWRDAQGVVEDAGELYGRRVPADQPGRCRCCRFG